jgi:hypothetical protein
MVAMYWVEMSIIVLCLETSLNTNKGATPCPQHDAVLWWVWSLMIQQLWPDGGQLPFNLVVVDNQPNSKPMMYSAHAPPEAFWSGPWPGSPGQPTHTLHKSWLFWKRPWTQNMEPTPCPQHGAVLWWVLLFILLKHNLSHNQNEKRSSS